MAELAAYMDSTSKNWKTGLQMIERIRAADPAQMWLLTDTVTEPNLAEYDQTVDDLLSTRENVALFRVNLLLGENNVRLQEWKNTPPVVRTNNRRNVWTVDVPRDKCVPQVDFLTALRLDGLDGEALIGFRKTGAYLLDKYSFGLRLVGEAGPALITGYLWREYLERKTNLVPDSKRLKDFFAKLEARLRNTPPTSVEAGQFTLIPTTGESDHDWNGPLEMLREVASNQYVYDTTSIMNARAFEDEVRKLLQDRHRSIQYYRLYCGEASRKRTLFGSKVLKKHRKRTFFTRTQGKSLMADFMIVSQGAFRPMRSIVGFVPQASAGRYGLQIASRDRDFGRTLLWQYKNLLWAKAKEPIVAPASNCDWPGGWIGGPIKRDKMQHEGLHLSPWAICVADEFMDALQGELDRRERCEYPNFSVVGSWAETDGARNHSDLDLVCIFGKESLDRRSYDSAIEMLRTVSDLFEGEVALFSSFVHKSQVRSAAESIRETNVLPVQTLMYPTVSTISCWEHEGIVKDWATENPIYKFNTRLFSRACVDDHLPLSPPSRPLESTNDEGARKKRAGLGTLQQAFMAMPYIICSTYPMNVRRLIASELLNYLLKWLPRVLRGQLTRVWVTGKDAPVCLPEKLLKNILDTGNSGRANDFSLGLGLDEMEDSIRCLTLHCLNPPQRPSADG